MEVRFAHNDSKNNKGRQSSPLAGIVGKSLSVQDVTLDSKRLWPEGGNARVKINVSGREFVTKLGFLRKYPETLLGNLVAVSQHFDPVNGEFFFARQPAVFASVLDLYHGDELHLPKDVCEEVITAELRFWRVELSQVSPCCAFWLATRREERERREHMRKLFDESVVCDPKRCGLESRHRWHYKLWRLLEDFRYSPASKVWMVLYLTIVLFSIFLAATQTSRVFREPIQHLRNKTFAFSNMWPVGKSWRSIEHLFMMENSTNVLLYLTTDWNYGLHMAELACAVFFTLENLTRFLLCPWKASFYKNWINAVDGICVVVYWISWLCKHLVPHPTDVRFIVLLCALDMALVVRVVRFLKLPSRYNGLRVLYLTLFFCWKELVLLQIFVFLGMCTFGFMVYLVEFPFSFAFPNIFDGWWWCGVTMTTVGYGDFVPQSLLGKIVAVFCALTGAVFLGLPVPIVSRRFSDFYTFATLMTKVKKLERKRNKYHEKHLCAENVKAPLS